IPAVLGKDGHIQVDPFFSLQAGSPTPSSAGAYEVRAVDSAGVPVSGVSLDVSFKAEAEDENGVGEIDVDAVPVVVQLPFSENIAQIQFVKDGQVFQTSPVKQQIHSPQSSVSDFLELTVDGPRKVMSAHVKVSPSESNYEAVLVAKLDGAETRISELAHNE